MNEGRWEIEDGDGGLRGCAGDERGCAARDLSRRCEGCFVRKQGKAFIAVKMIRKPAVDAVNRSFCREGKLVKPHIWKLEWNKGDLPGGPSNTQRSQFHKEVLGWMLKGRRLEFKEAKV